MASFTHLSTLVDGSFAHMGGIRCLNFVPSSAARLFSVSYSDGGLNGFDISMANGAASLVSSTTLATGAGLFNFRAICLEDLWGKDMVITSSAMTGQVKIKYMSPTGDAVSYGAANEFNALLGKLEAAITVNFGDRYFMFSSHMDQAGLSSFRVTKSIELLPLSDVAVGSNTVVGAIKALETIKVGGKNFVIALDHSTDSISSFYVNYAGTATEIFTYGAGAGSGFSHANILKTVEIGDRSFVLLGACGTSSISVLEIGSNGRMTEVDHVADTTETRFQNISAMAVFEYRGRDFVLVGGSDDGVSVFELNPDGSLFLLTSIEDQANTTLNNVQAISAHASNTAVTVAVSGEGEAGVTVFDLNLGNVGLVFQGTAASENIFGNGQDNLLFGGSGDDRLYGRHGNDRLYDGAGRDVMFGGAGADVFVFSDDNNVDFALQFTLHEDRLDLSAFDMLYNISQLKIISIANGARISYYGDVFKVISLDRTPLDASDFTSSDFIF